MSKSQIIEKIFLFYQQHPHYLGDCKTHHLTFGPFIIAVCSFLQRHPYHLVDFSPWPFAASIAAFSCATTGVMYLHGYKNSDFTLLISFLILIFIMFIWWRDVIREAVFEGWHTSTVQKGLRYGVILFIISEVLFFFGFFWAFFYNSCEPALSVGAVWPPLGINSVDTWKVPLLNTLILLSSGFTVTWAHHALISKNRVYGIWGLLLTIFYAFLFMSTQALEYYSATFCLSDGIYGTVFYMTTGFHGFHVLIGTIFLSVCCYRLIIYHFTWQHHFGFEAAVWYWHFVGATVRLYYFIINFYKSLSIRFNDATQKIKVSKFLFWRPMYYIRLKCISWIGAQWSPVSSVWIIFHISSYLPGSTTGQVNLN